MSLNPSLPSAARLTHRTHSGLGENVIGRIIWRSRTGSLSIEQSLREWSGISSRKDQVISPAIEALISAQSESSRERVSATSSVLVKRMNEKLWDQMRSYSSSLKAPSTALFALGVLLPVLLATMIPLAGLTLRTVIMIGAFLWIVVPLIIVQVSGALVLKRPILSSREQERKKVIVPSLRFFPLFSMGISIATFCLTTIISGYDFLVILDGPFPSSSSSRIMLILLSISFIIASVCSLLSSNGTEMKNNDVKLVPDLLSEIGTQMIEGRSFERAVHKGYGRIGMDLPLRGKVLHGTAAGPISTSVMVAMDLTSAGGRAGGNALKALSRHLTEMMRLEDSMREMIRSDIGQMGITASIFAPLMIGSSIGIFTLMDGTTSAIEGGQLVGGTLSRGDLSVQGFIFLAGIYLMLLSIATTIALHRLEEGSPFGGWKKVPGNVVLSSLMFILGVVGSTLLLGG
jgi:hypothetical protein